MAINEKTINDLLNKLKEINGELISEYTSCRELITYKIDDLILTEPAYQFKSSKYKRLIKLKEEMKKNGDKYNKVIGIDNFKRLIINISTYDNGEINISANNYGQFVKGRESFYKLAKERNINVLSHYLGNDKPIFIDFNCKNGSKGHWTTPSSFKACGYRCWCEKCKSEYYSGNKNPSWKSGNSNKLTILRHSNKYIQWRIKVYERDNYTCQCCGDKIGHNLVAHHIINFSENIKERFDINNGITLCKNCHNPTIKNSFHNIYGTKNNTLEQLQEYIKRKRCIK